MIYRNSNQITGVFHHTNETIQVIQNSQILFENQHGTTIVGPTPLLFTGNSESYIDTWNIQGKTVSSQTPSQTSPATLSGLGRKLDREIVADEGYLFKSAVTYVIDGREYSKLNDLPAVGVIIHINSGYTSGMFISTSADAVGYSAGGSPFRAPAKSFVYNGTTMYCSQTQHAMAGYSDDVSGNLITYPNEISPNLPDEELYGILGYVNARLLEDKFNVSIDSFVVDDTDCLFTEPVSWTISLRDYYHLSNNAAIGIIITSTSGWTNAIWISPTKEAVDDSVMGALFHSPKSFEYKGQTLYASNVEYAQYGDLVDDSGHLKKYPEKVVFEELVTGVCLTDDDLKNILDYVGYVPKTHQEVEMNQMMYGAAGKYDEITYKNGVGKLIQRYAVDVITGNEGLWRMDDTTTPGWHIFTCVGLPNIAPAESFKDFEACSHFEINASWNEDHTGAFRRIDTFGITLPVGNDLGIESLGGLREWLIAQKTAGTPLTIVYPLETPIETPITLESIPVGIGTNITDILCESKPTSVTITGDITPYTDSRVFATIDVDHTKEV